MKKMLYVMSCLLILNSRAWAANKTHEKYHNVDHLSFISSQVPVNPKGILVSSSIDKQIQQTFENLVNTAQEAGATIEAGKIKNVVKLNVYLKDMATLAIVDKYMLKYLTGNLPAITPVGGIDMGSAGYLVSMDAIVELPQ